jgi:hypothetical protein
MLPAARAMHATYALMVEGADVDARREFDAALADAGAGQPVDDQARKMALVLAADGEVG